MSQNPIVKWPFGAATLLVLLAATNAVLEINNTLTIIDGESAPATEDRTLDLDITPDMEPGARLVVKHTATATEKLIPGEGMRGAEIEGEAGKTAIVEYMYDGTKFVQIGEPTLID